MCRKEAIDELMREMRSGRGLVAMVECPLCRERRTNDIMDSLISQNCGGVHLILNKSVVRLKYEFIYFSFLLKQFFGILKFNSIITKII